jgi:hypothetical protein
MVTNEVMIGGEEYIRRSAVISDECLKDLYELYQMIHCEAFYDPYNAKTQEFAERLWPHIKAVNSELKFKK